MADTYFKNLKLIEATGTPTDSTYYYEVPNEKVPYTVNVYRSTPESKYVSERGIINGIPVLINNSSYKGIPQYTDSLFNGYSTQYPEGKFYKLKVDKATKEFQEGGAVSKNKKISWPYNSYYTEGDNNIPVKVNMFETTPNDTIIGVTSLTNKLPYIYTKLSGNDSKVIKMIKDPNDITKQIPSYEEGSEKDYYINLSRQVFKNKNPEKWYNKLEDFMRSIAHPEVDKLKFNKYQQGGSIVDYLNSQGLASDWNTRKAMARRYGVTDYKGTADQNLRLMELIKANQGMSPTTTMQGVPVTREVEDGRVETYTPDFTVKTPGYIDMTLYQKPVAQPLTFKLAFRNALNAGLAEFEWNGGRYNTELAQPAVETKKIEVKQQYTEPRLLRVPDPITRTVISEVDPKLRSNTLEYGKAQAEAAMERMHLEALLGEWNAASLDEKKALASQGRIPKGVVWNISTPVARYTGGQAYGWRGIR